MWGGVCVATTTQGRTAPPVGGRGYLRGAVGALVFGLLGEPLLLLVQRFGLEDHLLQLKGRVAVQPPPLWTERRRREELESVGLSGLCWSVLRLSGLSVWQVCVCV